jgi:hypothetical protein
MILLFAASLSFAGDKISIDDIYGTWVNSDYNEMAQFAKVIISPERMGEGYKIETDSEPSWIWEITVADSWHDSDGNLWIKWSIVTVDTGYKAYELNKFSRSGSVWEWVHSAGDYPTEMSPIAGTYSIHYRQD